MRWLVIAALFAAACYSPKIGDCAQACGTGNTCGPGLTCDPANNTCRTPSLVGTTCGDTDAPRPIDAAATADVAPEACTFEIVSMNFDPSDLPTSQGAWNVTGDTVFTTGTGGGRAVAQADGNDLWLVHHTTVTVDAGATLTIEGMHPLVIAADTIDVQGTIVVNNGAGHSECDAQRGANACEKGAGGGGAGYGAKGGNGGGSLGAGGAPTNITQIPLRGGCPGAQGGDGRTGATDATPRAGGLGGVAGGGLQLSGRLKVTIAGQILANGRGGGEGISDPAGGGACPGLLGRASGGGGGGGGGMIFIESCETVITDTAKLCANGGGGGGGAGGGNTDKGQPGADGNCDAFAAGGMGELATANGGRGGFDGQPAVDGLVGMRGGGGGGGAVGRIFIRQVAGDPVTAGATIRPPANRSM